MSRLSPRLKLIFDHLIHGEPVWDFCCDHGLLGLGAYKSRAFPEVYFVDQVESIISRLQTRFEERFFEPQSSVKTFFYAKPAEDMATPLTGTVVIAGVGGHTIANIIRSHKDRGQLTANRFIFCPQNDENIAFDAMRSLNQFDFSFIRTEREISERGRIRKLLIFDKY